MFNNMQVAKDHVHRLESMVRITGMWQNMPQDVSRWWRRSLLTLQVSTGDSERFDAGASILLYLSLVSSCVRGLH